MADFAPQIWFRENIVKGKTPYNALVLYSGEDTLSFGKAYLQHQQQLCEWSNVLFR